MKTLERIAIGGKPGMGKTHHILTMPKPVHILYSDRFGGESDLVGLEDIGIIVHHIDKTNPRDSALAIISNKIRPAINAGKCESVVYDSVSMGMDAQVGKDSNNNRNSMELRKWGQSGNRMMDVLDALYVLPANILVTFHIKPTAILGGTNGKDRIGTMWVPGVIPMIAERIFKESGLMGYAWRVQREGSPDVFGTNFVQEQKQSSGELMRFQYVKAPTGWGSREPPDVSKWLKRLQDDAAAKRELARKAALEGASAPLPEPEPTPEPNEDGTDTQNKPELQLTAEDIP